MDGRLDIETPDMSKASEVSELAELPGEMEVLQASEALHQDRPV